MVNVVCSVAYAVNVKLVIVSHLGLGLRRFGPAGWGVISEFYPALLSLCFSFLESVLPWSKEAGWELSCF